MLEEECHIIDMQLAANMKLIIRQSMHPNLIITLRYDISYVNLKILLQVTKKKLIWYLMQLQSPSLNKDPEKEKEITEREAYQPRLIYILKR